MDMSVYLARRQEILFSYVMTAAVILAVGVVVIVVMSLGLTASTRRLTRKMKNLSTDNLMAHPEEAISTMVTPSGFSPEDFNHADAVAFGCPSMGAEELEESEFQPMFSSIEGELRDKKSLCSGPTAGATVNG